MPFLVVEEEDFFSRDWVGEVTESKSVETESMGVGQKREPRSRNTF